MAWKLIKAEIWLTSCDFVWECGGRVMFVMAYDKTMAVSIYWPGSGGMMKSFLEVPRNFVMTDAERDSLWDHVMEEGEHSA